MTRQTEERVLKLAWKNGPSRGSAGVVSVTRTEVFRYRDLVGISLAGLGQRRRWPELTGAVGVQLALDLRRRTSYTVSMWENADALNEFLRSPRHLASVRRYRDRVAVMGASWPTDRLVLDDAWAEAGRRLTSDPSAHHG